MNAPGSVVITGASAGIGAALLRCFVAANWQVHAVVRSAQSLQMDDIEPARRSDVSVYVADMSRVENIEQVARDLVAPVDILINNAATFASNAFYARDFQPSDFAEALATNVIGPAFLAQKLRPNLLAGSRKLIVMMSTGNASLAGNTTGQMLGYRASKSALNQVVRTMAAEWKDDGIATVALNPGWVRTRMGGEHAPLCADEAASNIFAFVTSSNANSYSGSFCNTDGSSLPW